MAYTFRERFIHLHITGSDYLDIFSGSEKKGDSDDFVGRFMKRKEAIYQAGLTLAQRLETVEWGEDYSIDQIVEIVQIHNDLVIERQC